MKHRQVETRDQIYGYRRAMKLAPTCSFYTEIDVVDGLILCKSAAFRLLFAVTYWGPLESTGVYYDLGKYMVTCPLAWYLPATA